MNGVSRTPPDEVERVARAIAEHFRDRFGAKIEEDNTCITVAMFDPPVPFRFNAANAARAALASIGSGAGDVREAPRFNPLTHKLTEAELDEVERVMTGRSTDTGSGG